MDSKLLQKIEELTLYTIDQEKQLNNQEKQLKAQNAEIKTLATTLIELQLEIENLKQ